MTPAEGPWARTVAVGRQSAPAFLLTAGLVLGAGLFLLDWVGWTSVERILRALPLVLAAAAITLAIARVARHALVRIPATAVQPRQFPAHPWSETAVYVSELCRAGRTDVPYLVDYVIHQALDARASDIHLVPYEQFVAVRFRIDGILHDVAELPPSVSQPVANRLKVVSRLVTFVRDRPQDGRFEFLGGDRRVDVRVAFMPTLHGERVVLRLLYGAGPGLGLASLGFTAEQYATFSELICRPQGMIAVTGPAGSGKTTTIYGALGTILEKSARSRSIYTLEDPVESDLLNINQTQIEETRRFTFAQGLRSLLRQDPDVIMVGEIRDLETARIALQAGMTGHLIITTVHARSAAGVFDRLIEMGAAPHSVASALTAAVSQRLVRLLCPHCKRVEPATPWLQAELGRSLEGATLFGPVGCPRCGAKGFRGRRALFEILEVDESLSRLIVERTAPEQLRREAVRRGMKTLIDVGLEMTLRGETSLAEVMRLAPPDATSD